METLALASGLAGVGYYLNNNNTNNGSRTRDVSGDNLLKNNQHNLQENIYNRSYYNTANQIEKKAVTEKYQNAQYPKQTNVISKDYNKNVFPSQKDSQFVFRPEATRSSNHRTEEPFQNYSSYGDTTFRSLSGQDIPMSQFTHNNMQPFVKGRVTQSTIPTANQSRLELFTGTSSYDIKKEELGPMFNPTKDMTNIYGSSVYTDEINERYIPSRYRQGEKVVQQIQVGPGLNQGYTAEPSGGYQQADMRDFVMPRDTNEMRTLNNPKLTYQGQIIPGSGPKQRGLVADVKKDRPDTYYINNPERYFTTVGANAKPKQNPEYIVKETNRQDEHEEYMGNAFFKTPKPMAEQTYKPSIKQQLEVTGFRNAEGQFANQVNQYGKEGFTNYSNERDTTQNNRYVASAISLVKALIAPIEDVIRTTRKENVIGNNRQAGNVQLPIKQLPVHDPNDIARTTIKETNIHNNHSGNLSGPKRNVVHDPNDLAKTTIKETNIHNNHSGNLSGPKRIKVHDPNDYAKTTIKETNIHNNHVGYLSGPTRLTVYDPNDIARTTIKETNIDNERLGNLGVYAKGAVFDPNDITKITGRQTLKLEDTNRNLSGMKKTVAFDPNDIPRTTIKQTTIDNNYQGNVEGVSTGMGYLTNPKEAPVTIRETTEDNNYVGDAVGKSQGAYHVTEYDAKDTQRQSLSDNSYTGNAMNEHKKPISYDDMYNAELNVMKEMIAEGREPTLSNVKLTVGGDDVNMDVKRLEMDEYNNRVSIVTKIIDLGPEREDLSKMTKDKFEYEQQGIERIDPEYLKAFRENPFTQPLDSAPFN